MTADREVTHFGLPQGGSRVVYRADQDVDEQFELYSVPVEGGLPVRLSGPMTLGGDVRGFFVIAPNSSRVVYLADQDTDETLELYSALVSGGGSTKLNGPPASGGQVRAGSQGVTADSIYRAEEGAAGVIELYSVPLAGPEGAARKISFPSVPGGDVQAGFVISPAEGHVLYLADHEVDERFELYSVAFRGPSSPTGVKLNGPLPLGSDVVGEPLWVPHRDDSVVIYRQ